MPKAGCKQISETSAADALPQVREKLAALLAREGELATESDAALVADNRIELDRVEWASADVRKQRERCERRIMLLEQQSVDDLCRRQEQARTDLLARVEAKFIERDAAVREMCSHMEAMIASFRKAVSATGSASAAWPFSPTDAQPAMFGTWLARAIGGELYRLSGSPFTASGAPRTFEFPGANCHDIRDPRPESVTPLAEQVKAASEYAISRMRAQPMRLKPVRDFRPPAVEASQLQSLQPTETAEVDKGPASEPQHGLMYAFDVDVANSITGAQKTIRVVFSADDAEDSYLDGIGPMGPRGREIATRLAEQQAPEGFVFDGRTEAMRFDLKALTQSMGA